MRLVAKACLVFALALVGIAPASASTFSFSYETSGMQLVTGRLDGSLGGDGNTFTVDGVDDFAVNGVVVTSYTVHGAVTTAPYDFGSTDAVYGVTGYKAPTVTLDGSVLDFLLYNGGYPLFVFAVGDQAQPLLAAMDPAFSLGGVGTTIDFGGDPGFHPFVRADFSANVESATPEPATIALIFAGLAAILGLHRRRQARK